MGSIITILVLILFAWVGIKIYQSMKDKEIMICSSCNNKFTRNHWRAHGQCPRCGSNLAHSSGQRAR